MEKQNTQTKTHYAVIFSSKRSDDDHAYEAMADKMVQLAKVQKGFIDVESIRGTDGNGITISYWETLENIATWKNNTQHLNAQELGRTKWYESYKIRICKVEREYFWPQK